MLEHERRLSKRLEASEFLATFIAPDGNEYVVTIKDISYDGIRVNETGLPVYGVLSLWDQTVNDEPVNLNVHVLYEDESGTVYIFKDFNEKPKYDQIYNIKVAQSELKNGLHS